MSFVFYLIPVALYLLYKWATSTHDYFEKQGVQFIKPLPLLGSNIGLFFKKQPFVQSMMDNYNKYKSGQVYGMFEFRRPIVFITDPKLVKQVMVKDFDHFSDHRVMITEDIDPLFGKLLISMTGQKWKDMRATLSPAFTGSKMRQMYDFVRDVGQQTAKSMKDDISKGGENIFEFKALAMKFAVDVIASCAFGIEIDSFKNPENDFHRIASRITNMSSSQQMLKNLGYMISPRLMKLFGISLFGDDVNAFFKQATTETMKVREQKGIIRQDMINLLMQAKKGQLTHGNTEEKAAEGFSVVEESQVGKASVKRVWDDDDLAAQTLLFFFAGFETIATAMSFMAYELVCNPEVQQKLHQEILDMNSELDGTKISYEQIQGMKYLDQTVSETLRKWPTPITERTCVKEFDLKLDGGKTLHFDTNVNVFAPVHCFHHDPLYFPEPEKFDPERFSPENRHKIDPDTYMPFGSGPRNCIGSRFALMELKTIIYYLLLNFSFEVTEKTQIPFKYEDVPMAFKPLNGTWVQLKPRED